MKRLNFVILAGLALFLSSCGAAALFVPPIETGDTLGVESKVVSLAMVTAGSQSSYKATGKFEKSFEDSSDIDLKGFAVGEYKATVSLDKEIWLRANKAATVSDFPTTLDLVDLSVSAKLEDEPHGVVSMAVKKPLSLKYSLDQESCKANKCKYVSADKEQSLSFVLANSDAAQLDKLIEIIKEFGGVSSTNKSIVNLEIKVKSVSSIDGYTMDIQLHSEGSTIKLR